MEFCQRCGTRLKSGHNSPHVLVCPICGFEKAVESSTPRPTVTKQASVECIKVIDQDEAGLRVLPTVKVECPKCDSKRAHYSTTEIGQEEETVEIRVFRCTLCGHTWRERG